MNDVQYTTYEEVPYRLRPYLKYSERLYKNIYMERTTLLADLISAQHDRPTKERQAIIDGIHRNLKFLLDMFNEGAFIDDKECNEVGIYIDYVLYHHDEAEKYAQDIEQLEEMLNDERCTLEIRQALQKAIAEQKAIMNYHKKKM